MIQDLPASELRLGDVVELFPGPWNHAVVKEIDERAQLVTFFRPYGTTADFSMGNRVICYIGLEEFSVSLKYTSVKTYRVLQRKELA